MDLFVRAVTQSARDLLGRSRKGGRDLASEIDVEIFRPPQCVYTIKFFCSDDRSDVKGATYSRSIGRTVSCGWSAAS